MFTTSDQRRVCVPKDVDKFTASKQTIHIQSVAGDAAGDMYVYVC